MNIEWLEGLPRPVRRLVGAAASVRQSVGHRAPMQIGVDRDGDWMNRQPGTTLYSPTVHAQPIKYIRNNALDLWCHIYTHVEGDTVVDVELATAPKPSSSARSLVRRRGWRPSGRIRERIVASKNSVLAPRVQQVSPIQAAITRAVCPIELSDDEVHNANAIVDGGTESNTTITVSGYPLDVLLRAHGVNNVDLFKMNIEGAEVDALLGAEVTLGTTRHVTRHVVISRHDFVAERGGPKTDANILGGPRDSGEPRVRRPALSGRRPASLAVPRGPRCAPTSPDADSFGWRTPVPLKVSILIISYHQEDFIAEALRSALDQGSDVEIVVADDHSADGTCDVVEEIAHTSAAHIRLIRGEHNVGITANCNRGLASCRGDLVAMLGGDDVMLPGKIAAQRDWMAASTRRVLCGHDADNFDNQTGATLYLESELVRFEPELTGAAGLCRGETFYSGSSAMLRRSAMPARGFDERLPMVSDRKLYIDTVGEKESTGGPGCLDAISAPCPKRESYASQADVRRPVGNLSISSRGAAVVRQGM